MRSPTSAYRAAHLFSIASKLRPEIPFPKLQRLGLHQPALRAYAMAPNSQTDLLFQRDGTTTTHNTTISSIQPFADLSEDSQALFKGEPENVQALITASTIFHVQGGGQPADTGLIHPASSKSPVFQVSGVRRTPSKRVLHFGSFSPAGGKFKEGEEVEQSIDPEKRLLHSRLHTGGHVLSLAIQELMKEDVLPKELKEGKASHYPGSAFVECIGSIPGTAKSAIQAKVDELVAADLPIKIHFWSEAEAIEKCAAVIDGSLEKGGEEGVRVVEVGDIGSYPCGGTHVKSCKELGRVVVRNIKRSKGVTKVSYEVQDA